MFFVTPEHTSPEGAPDDAVGGARAEIELVDPAAGAMRGVPPLDAGSVASGRLGAFAAHPDWLRAAGTHLCTSRPLVARVGLGTAERLRLPITAPARASVRASVRAGVRAGVRGRVLHHPAHAHLTLAELDVRPGTGDAALLDAVSAALEGAAPSAAAWRIGPVTGESPLVRAVRARAGVETGPLDARGWALRPARLSAWFELAGDAPLVPGKLRRNLRRLRGRLEGDASSDADTGPDTGPGAPTGAAVARLALAGPALRSADEDPVPGGDELDAAFARFLRVEASGWKSAGGTGTAIADDPALTGFYRALLTPTSPGLLPGIAELRRGDRTVAAVFALRTGTTLHVLKTAHDEALGACSPGSLLLESLLVHCRESGLARLSLVTSPAWAERWHPFTVPAWHVVRYADTATGRLVAFADRARDAARRHHRRLLARERGR